MMQPLSPEQQEQLQKRLARIVSVGSKMRVAQNDYFRTRGSIALTTAKRAEAEFDSLIREENKQQQSKQAGLF